MKRQIEPIIKLLFLIFTVVLFSPAANAAYLVGYLSWSQTDLDSANYVRARCSTGNIQQQTTMTPNLKRFQCQYGDKEYWLKSNENGQDCPTGTTSDSYGACITPTAPDISSCNRDTLPINIGPEGSPQFPDLNDIHTDPDGCQYKIDTTQPGFVIERCDKDPDSGDVICEYKVEPSSSIPPPDPSPDTPEMPSNGQPTTTPIQDDTKDDLIIDWESWEPNPPHQEEFIDPDNVVTITLPDGGTVDITIAPDGTITIDAGDYSPNEIPIVRGPNGYPQPNPGYSPPGGGSPGGSGPSGGSPDGPIGVPGVGGTGGDSGGDGSGDGEGDGDGDGDQDNQDYSYESPPGKDDLYEKSDKTFQSVLDNFVTQAQQAPFFNAVDTFFDINISGTCPVWIIPETAYTPALVIDQQCSPTMNQLWPYIAAIIFAVAGFIAFRLAVL
jgi:hypothetical protein